MTPYDRAHPFRAAVTRRFRLNRVGSSKETWHVELDLQGSGMAYRPGDSFAVCPRNDEEEVDRFIRNCGWDGSASIIDPKSTPEDIRTSTLREWLIVRANLAMCTKKLLEAIAMRDGSPALMTLLEAAGTEHLHDYLTATTVVEAVQEYMRAHLPPQEFANTLSPLLPRFYSAASAPSVVGEAVHFTVARVRYEIHGKKRLGVCSHFLCDMVQEGERVVPVYLQPTRDFLLPDDNSIPIIMVGPGTGVAPFRAFMQERLSRGNFRNNWLFFGERHQQHDFLYEEYWQELVHSASLKLTTAFSRDTPEKVYVHHKMWDERVALWQWLQEGAYLYVCGDASHMAKDVDACIHNIARECGSLGPDEAKRYVTELRRKKRYVRDIYTAST